MIFAVFGIMVQVYLKVEEKDIQESFMIEECLSFNDKCKKNLNLWHCTGCYSRGWVIGLGIDAILSIVFVEKVCARAVWEYVCARSPEICKIEVIWMDTENSIDYLSINCSRRWSAGKSTGEDFFHRL
ncbi:hypothetical protein SANA_00260 [Gottschalkiaceae bacterium SANA]|nr:hypothetical protein SANA_00260 [Gottschalkiaceae bacterium SANA]